LHDRPEKCADESADGATDQRGPGNMRRPWHIAAGIIRLRVVWRLLGLLL